MSLVDRYLSSIGSAQVNEGGVYFIPGDYVVNIDAWKEGTTRQGRPFLVAETTILWSNVADRKAGTRCSWMCMLDNDSAPGNVKGFLAGCFGFDWKAVPEKDWLPITHLAVSPQQPLKNRRVRVQASNTKTKKNQDFTICRFSPYDGQNPVAIAA